MDEAKSDECAVVESIDKHGASRAASSSTSLTDENRQKRSKAAMRGAPSPPGMGPLSQELVQGLAGLSCQEQDLAHLVYRGSATPNVHNTRVRLTPHAVLLGGSSRPQLLSQQASQHVDVHGRHFHTGTCQPE
eukprot:CAMPEP_0119280848 /NCGR_PEP_ID=MMETSP1329-20130426/23534_1 /TAXON_ID=114041 /ORGANISM="Genus nov. species nov., Strain RCC1024" /LENGTH=132 /DNA_ID=CAMNT_0007281449 /DNA_START=147 /DNA_END=547 /DNA_ORIENTATION=+